MKKAYTASSLKQALEKIKNAGGVLIDKSDIDLLTCPTRFLTEIGGGFLRIQGDDV